MAQCNAKRMGQRKAAARYSTQTCTRVVGRPLICRNCIGKKHCILFKKFSKERRQAKNRKSAADSKGQRIRRHAAMVAEINEIEVSLANLEATLERVKWEQEAWRAKLEQMVRQGEAYGKKVVEAVMPQVVRLFAT